MIKPKLRVSFSLLSLWEKGEVDRAVAMYLHKEYPRTPQMEEGIKFDELNDKHITDTGRMMPEFGGLKLKKPTGKKEIIADYNELFIVKGILDNYDEPDVYEYKTGRRSSSSYLSSLQLPFYAMLCEMTGTPCERLIVIRHNQYDKTYDWALMHNGPHLIKQARNFIDTLAPEVYRFFDEQGYL